MSKELAEQLEHERNARRLVLGGLVLTEDEYNEAIAAMRSEPEPVGEVTSSGEYALPVFRWLSADHSLRCQIGDKLYAAPSRESQRSEAERIAGSRSNSGTQSSDHPTEQDADELLREVLDWGLPDDLKQRIDAYLARKEQ